MIYNKELRIKNVESVGKMETFSGLRKKIRLLTK